MEYSKIQIVAPPVIVVPLVVTAAFAGLLLWETFDLNRSMQWVDHTDQVSDQSGHLSSCWLIWNRRSADTSQPATRASFIPTGRVQRDSNLTSRSCIRCWLTTLSSSRYSTASMPAMRTLKPMTAGFIALRRAGKADPTLLENQQQNSAWIPSERRWRNFKVWRRSAYRARPRCAPAMDIDGDKLPWFRFGSWGFSRIVHSIQRRKIRHQAIAERGAMDCDSGQHWRGRYRNRQRSSSDVPNPIAAALTGWSAERL